MKRTTPHLLRIASALTALAFGSLAGASIPAANAADSGDYQRGYDLGMAAYKYGLPLITIDKTFQHHTSINVPNGRGLGPVNQFSPVREFATPEDRSVVAPNFDTLYNIAWLDLSDEPQVIHVPKIKGRYYVIPMLDPYTENFANLGSVEKTPAGDYAVVGPDDADIDLPKHVTRIESPYDRVFIIMRTYASNTDQRDIAEVNRLHDHTTVVPLSKYPRKNWTPAPPAVVDTEVNDPGLPAGMAYFDRLSALMAEFPPPAADQPLLDEIAEIGVGAGLTPSQDPSLSEETVAGMVQATKDAPAVIRGDVNALYGEGFAAHNGYLVTATGNYGTDYRLRAVVTQVGFGALPPEQAIYPLAVVDRFGAPLTGAKRYKLHIPAGGLPPVDGFWSFTMYDRDGFLVPNELDRYVLNDRSELHYNEDGSLDLYLQHDKPTDPDQAANWLPAPEGELYVLWRMYALQTPAIPGVLDGTGWQPPAIIPVA